MRLQLLIRSDIQLRTTHIYLHLIDFEPLFSSMKFAVEVMLLRVEPDLDRFRLFFFPQSLSS